MNTHVALSGIGRGSGGKKVQRSSSQTSSTSIQVDSGLGHEDKTWGGELINLPPGKEISISTYIQVCYRCS